ncbi:hypothetical protein GWK26_12760 [haloarchaeon 3A1-DGR]|nr:hypothetical protein GWK26_12760 [haloarchaeon 3A1-DGR]
MFENEPNSQDSTASDLPTSAYHLGRDADGRDHYHDPMSTHVWVARDGDIVHETDLEQRSIVLWVQFVDEECGGWAERERVEETGGLDELLEGVFEREAECRERRIA